MLRKKGLVLKKMLNKKGQTSYLLQKLADFVLSIGGFIFIMAVVVSLIVFLFRQTNLPQSQITLKILVGEINDLNEGEKFDIAMFGNHDYFITAYSGKIAQQMCPGRVKYCVCLIMDNDSLCKQVKPKQSDVKLTVINQKIALSQNTITLEHKSNEIILS